MKPCVLVCGFTGAGKTSLIQAICGSSLVPEKLIGHGKPQTMDFQEFSSENVSFWDSRGFEPGEEIADYISTLEKFTKKRRKGNSSETHVHAIWYCIQGIGGRVTDFDLDAIQRLSEVVPNVFAVITKEDFTSKEQLREMKKALKQGDLDPNQIVSVSQENEDSLINLVRRTEERMPGYESFLDMARMEEAAERFQARKENVEEEADAIINWAAGRAAAIALIPIPLADVYPLVANQGYMLQQLGALYGIDVTEQVMGTLVGITGASLGGMLLASFIPGFKVVIAGSVTYATGIAAKDWFAGGMNASEEEIREKYEAAKTKAEKTNWAKKAA